MPATFRQHAAALLHPGPPPPDLLRHFRLLAGVVLFLGMIGTGLWIGAQIRRVAIQNAATVTALYVDAMISPVAQELELAPDLSPVAVAALEQLMRQGGLANQVLAFKVFNGEGLVIFSTRPELVGQSGKENPRLQQAMSGEVHASLKMRPGFDTPERQELMEVYSPIRSAVSGEVIGVAEFYTSTARLRADILSSQLRGWLVVGCVTLAMFGALHTVFARGSRIIRQQRQALEERIAALSSSLAENAALARRVEQANLRIAEVHERSLRRLSADLHDGPAQHLAFAALRLDAAPGQEQVAEAVNEALEELRLICRGLALPELADLDPAGIASRLAAAAQARSGMKVALRLSADLPEVPLAVKGCVYRFVQEALNNAAHHALPPDGRAVMARITLCSKPGGTGQAGIEVRVSDNGRGFDPAHATHGLGLLGLRERVSGLGGHFDLRSMAGRGTVLRIWLPVAGEGGGA